MLRCRVFFYDEKFRVSDKDSEIKGLYVFLPVAAERIITKIVRHFVKGDMADRFLTDTFLLHILIITALLSICFVFDRIR